MRCMVEIALKSSSPNISHVTYDNTSYFQPASDLLKERDRLEHL